MIKYPEALPALPKLNRRSLPQVVADAIRSQILTGQLAMGARVDQDAIASMLGVSRIPVREALRQLDVEGLVEIVPHRGAFVAALSREEIREIYEIRDALEPLAVRLAVPQISEEQLKACEALLAQMDAVSDPLHWLDLNQEFHRALYEPTGRPSLCSLIETLRWRSERYLRVYVAQMGRVAMAQREHREILAAYRALAARAAVRALRRHLRHTLEGLMVVLASTPPDDAHRRA